MSYHAYSFRYPDGPHNAETLLVNDSGRLFIVTKGQEAAVYAAPSKPDRQGVNKLKKVGTAPSGVTDGTFLPSGDKIALLTYGSVVVIDASTYEVLASFPIPHQPKAGSLTLSLDEKSLLVGPKGKKSKVYTVPVPGEASPGPRQAPAKTQARTPMSQRTRPMPFRTRRELDWHSGSLLSWRRLILPVAGVRAEGRRAGDQARRSAARRLFGIRRVASSPEYVAGGGLRSVLVSPLHVVRCQIHISDYRPDQLVGSIASRGCCRASTGSRFCAWARLRARSASLCTPAQGAAAPCLSSRERGVGHCLPHSGESGDSAIRVTPGSTQDSMGCAGPLALVDCVAASAGPGSNRRTAREAARRPSNSVTRSTSLTVSWSLSAACTIVCTVASRVGTWPSWAMT